MAEMPKRIQRRRAKGWRMPEGAVYVGRGSPWGNPFIVGRDGTAAECVRLYNAMIGGYFVLTTQVAVAEQRAMLDHVHAHYRELTGRDLACWCRPGAPCHADTLLWAANLPASQGAF